MEHTMPMRRTQPARQRIGGMTLIQLMVALAIGAFLMVGAVTVFMQGRTTFRVNESLARMQENARFALDTLEPDIRMAHYWGLTTRTANILGRASWAADEEEAEEGGEVEAVEVVEGEVEEVVEDVGMGPTTCGNNWTVDLDRAIDGANNGYAWAACGATGGAQAGADSFVVRRASEDRVDVPVANTMYIQSARYEDSQLFIGAAIPAGYLPPPASQTHRLIVNGYYISGASTNDDVGNPIPSLRRKTLITGPAIEDQELLSGVEDMQVQFGVDTDAAGSAERGSVDQYVNPGDPILDTAEILAVRIWLRVRAERRENGFTDTTNYVYADQDFTPVGDDAQFRRIVVSKTIYIRNARPAL